MKNFKFLSSSIALLLIGMSYTSYTGVENDMKYAETMEPSCPLLQKIIKINGVDQVQTVTMDGEKLLINGSGNKITVQGFASAIEVQGTDNEVTVDIVNKIDIYGVDNKVKYRSSKNKNKRPSITSAGVDNSTEKF